MFSIFLTNTKQPRIMRSLRGFTLVELLVASSIFSSVLIIAIGALFSAQAINTRLQETQIILDSVNLATEVISRDIRYGSEFHCENNNATATVATIAYYQVRRGCSYPAGGNVLTFKPQIPLEGTVNSSKDRVSYFVASVPYNGTTSKVIFKEEYPGGTSLYRLYQITPTDVSITALVFYVHGANSSSGAIDYLGASDNDQPLVTMSIGGVTIPSRRNVDPVTFNLEVTSSARGLDN